MSSLNRVRVGIRFRSSDMARVRVGVRTGRVTFRGTDMAALGGLRGSVGVWLGLGLALVTGSGLGSGLRLG